METAIDLNLALEAVAEEPELPGTMPEEMWDVIRNDREAVSLAIRIAVRQTKDGIMARIISKFQARKPKTKERQ